VPEWVALRLLLDQAEVAPSALARAMGMTRGGVTKLVDRLIAKGLVVRRAGAEDRRYQALALTREGRALVPALAALADRNDAEFFGHLKPAERAAIEAALQEIARRHAMETVPVE
jgi:DNA-binding MarR family transcriptional regulator